MSPENNRPWNSRQTALAKIISQVLGGTPPQTSTEFSPISPPEDSSIRVRAQRYKSPLATDTRQVVIDREIISKEIRKTQEMKTLPPET